MAFELLETAAQARAVRCGRDAQSVTLVIRRGPGSDVGKWDGGGLRFRAGGHLEAKASAARSRLKLFHELSE